MKNFNLNSYHGPSLWQRSFHLMGSGSRCKSGQSAVEYFLILTVVAIVVFVGFNNLLPAIQSSQDPIKNPSGFFTKVDKVILGAKPQPINGGWCVPECPPSGSCGDQTRYKTCECPAPAFGGTYCSGSDVVTCQGVKPCK
jgi:hypothetical protein